MSKPTILVIDDEPQIRKLLEINLENNGYSVQLAESGKEGILRAANHPPELIILDLGLPDKNGQQVLQELRTWYNKPIVILSALNDEINIVKALDNGANDYLCKPFRTQELLARLRSCLRNTEQHTTSNTLEFEDVFIDLSARIVTVNKSEVHLTSTEYSILVLFTKYSGKVLTHQFILKEIWGPGFQTQTQYLRVFIGQLRKKIEQNPNTPKHIVTESRVGYRFM